MLAISQCYSLQIYFFELSCYIISFLWAKLKLHLCILYLEIVYYVLSNLREVYIIFIVTCRYFIAYLWSSTYARWKFDWLCDIYLAIMYKFTKCCDIRFKYIILRKLWRLSYCLYYCLHYKLLWYKNLSKKSLSFLVSVEWNSFNQYNIVYYRSNFMIYFRECFMSCHF